MNGHYNHNLFHQKQGCGRTHDREWESSVNGRAKQRHERTPVPTLTRIAPDARRDRSDRRSTRSSDTKTSPADARSAKSNVAPQMDGQEKPAVGRSQRTSNSKSKSSHVYQNQKGLVQKTPVQVEAARVRGIASYQSATACYVGAGVSVHDSGVFGVYAETKYTFAVNGLPGNPAQASAAAAFFARYVFFLVLISYKYLRVRVRKFCFVAPTFYMFVAF